MSYPGDFAVHERVLERLRYAAHGQISEEFLRGMHADSAMNELSRTLVLRLCKDVLADRVLDDEAQVPFSATVRTDQAPRSVLVELPQPWWRRLLGLPRRCVWAHVVGDAAYATDADTMTIHGAATVRAEYFRTFPETTLAYPEGMGPARLLVRTSAPFDHRTWPHRLHHAQLPYRDEATP